MNTRKLLYPHDATPLQLGATISRFEHQTSPSGFGSGRRSYEQVLIELPDQTEFTLGFPCDASDAQVLNEPIRNWKVV